MKHNFSRILLTTGFLLTCLQLTGLAQGFDRIERERAKDMLKTIKNEVEKNYYDPTFRGLDLEVGQIIWFLPIKRKAPFGFRATLFSL